MMKKTLYSKTSRIGKEKKQYVITEKLDGSNCVFFKKDNELYVATRNNILNLREDTEHFKKVLYKGMQGWLEEYIDLLESALHEGSAIIGEWVGMGKIKYPHLKERFYMFAKGNVDDNFELNRVNYTHEFFMYSFIEQEIPDFIGVVPIVKIVDEAPSIIDLDILYDEYCLAEERDVEGFVVQYDNHTVKKYVRMKNGKLEPHKS